MCVTVAESRPFVLYPSGNVQAQGERVRLGTGSRTMQSNSQGRELGPDCDLLAAPAVGGHSASTTPQDALCVSKSLNALGIPIQLGPDYDIRCLPTEFNNRRGEFCVEALPPSEWGYPTRRWLELFQHGSMGSMEPPTGTARRSVRRSGGVPAAFRRCRNGSGASCWNTAGTPGCSSGRSGSVPAPFRGHPVDIADRVVSPAAS